VKELSERRFITNVVLRPSEGDKVSQLTRGARLGFGSLSTLCSPPFPPTYQLYLPVQLGRQQSRGRTVRRCSGGRQGLSK